MSRGLLVLSNDPLFVGELRRQIPEDIELVVSETVDSPRGSQGRCVGGVIAHLSGRLLNGYSTEGFMQRLRKTAGAAPVVGVVDPSCPDELRCEVAKLARGCVSSPVSFQELDSLLTAAGQMAGSFDGLQTLPHRVLRGQTRSLVTFTPQLFEIFDELQVAAAHDVTILLIGETGSGKTYLARLIHELSARRAERCLTVACGALPPDLIESELFGYVRGAFTGADGDREGKFAAARNGTLLLDEIDVLAPEQQAKLLRVIETGEYEPVGSNDTRTSNARLIVASNIDLQELVGQNKFRMDLFYRLNTLSFFLPPLRERPWDIEFLARQFALEHSQSHHIQLQHIEPELIAALKQYPWPGNIRELENVMRRAVLYCREGVLTTADLPSTLRKAAGMDVCPVESRRGGMAPTFSSGIGSSLHPAHPPQTLEERVDAVERRIIEESLQRHNFHRTETARELGISRVTLYNKMKRFGMLH